MSGKEITSIIGRDNLYINLNTSNTDPDKRNIVMSSEVKYDRPFLGVSSQADFAVSVNTASIPLSAIPIITDCRNTNYWIVVQNIDEGGQTYTRNLYNDGGIAPNVIFEHGNAGPYTMYDYRNFVLNLDNCYQMGLQLSKLNYYDVDEEKQMGPLSGTKSGFKLVDNKICFYFDDAFYSAKHHMNLFFNRELANVIGLYGVIRTDPMTQPPAADKKDVQLSYMENSGLWIPTSSGLHNLNQVHALVIRSSLPIRNEILQTSYKSTDLTANQSTLQRILTTMNIQNQLDRNGSAIYNSQSEYRRAVLQDSTDIRDVKIEVYYQLKDGLSYPAYMRYGEMLHIKLLFERIQAR